MTLLVAHDGSLLFHENGSISIICSSFVHKMRSIKRKGASKIANTILESIIRNLKENPVTVSHTTK